MSAHSASWRGGWLSALVAHVSEYVFEEVEETVEPPPPVPLAPQRVVAVVAAAPRAGASTIARLLAAELASRADGSAIVLAPNLPRRAAPPSRAAIRLTTAVAGIAAASPCGRLCIVAGADRARIASPVPDLDRAGIVNAAPEADRAGIVNAARFLAPVVIELPADGSAAGIAAVADRVVVVAPADGEPALLDAVAAVVGGDPVKVVSRVTDAASWLDRADVLLPDSRLGARAAAIGTKAIGSLGAAIGGLADRFEDPR